MYATNKKIYIRNDFSMPQETRKVVLGKYSSGSNIANFDK